MNRLRTSRNWGQTGSASDAKPSTPRRTGLFANIRDDLHAACQEFIGTTVFLTLAFGGVQASAAEDGSSGATVSTGVNRIMYISLCFGFSLLVSAWLFYRVTGGLFNPNVSTALFLTGIIGPVRFVLYCVAQLIGGIAAAALVFALTPGPIASKCVNSVARQLMELMSLQHCSRTRDQSCAGCVHRGFHYSHSVPSNPYAGCGEAHCYALCSCEYWSQRIPNLTNHDLS
jgi:hypothetical protein